ncbi:Ig-like domain-containing protein [Urbifossiella limnaea]|uniref:Leupeptin-inactivating enzyme 1 n=1 Tax=Urbifossiella limnaea TaxID=2528023 RepID=A0A517XKX4_9BACT|nr:Ig-like domain-containing protein [Urbifossiella limnaea]QDU18158.1 Leupeptin-inactivating enzyme 1 precursor [Urbifossiella limnaea]
MSVFTRPRLALEGLESREVPDAAQVWAVAGGTYDLAQTFNLHSNPTANHTVFLDFDGHTTGDVTGTNWDNLTSPAYDPANNGAAFSDAEKQTMQKIWARVSEDFAPFNINVTTEQPANLEDLRKFGTGDTRWGIRVVVTPNDAPAPGSGGVAYVGSFNYSNYTPVYVFNTGEKSVAEAASHEAGHALGLGHDGTATAGYYSGHGTGVTSWGPIMGASYSPNLTQWSKGEYTGANNTQDDLAVITGNNGFTYRVDDFGNTLATATPLLAPGSAAVSTTFGVVERNTDADVFSFYAGAGLAAITVDPLALGPNLAVQAELMDATGTVLMTVNPSAAINAAVSYTLPEAGLYFLRVSGTGKGSVGGTGFSNYGSLGNYRVTGTVPPYSAAPNQAPVAANDSATTAAGTPVTVDVLANDSDPDGDALTITGLTNLVGGTAVVSNGRVVFTPTAGFSGAASFVYTISDGRGGVASATAAVTVTAPVNRAPVAVNDSASTTAGTPVTVDVLANDSDPDGDALTVTGVTNVVGGTAVISNGRVVFTPTAGFSGTGSFVYSISDGRGGVASATAAISVAAPPATQSFTNGTDVAITASRRVTVSSTVVVSGLTGPIQDVNVSLNLFHTYTRDLRITLIAPDGTAVRLFNRYGGSGNNLLGTTFDDQAATAVSGAAAPFTGTFRPGAALAALNGRSPNGTWRLQVEDLSAGDGGYLDTWTLTLTTGAAAAAPAAFAPAATGEWAARLAQFLEAQEEQRRRRGTPLDAYLAPEADLPRG